jgi:WD40 repeat protein/TPR repeat protein
MKSQMTSDPSVGPKDPASFYFVDGGTMKIDAPSYVDRRADRDLYEALKVGKYCYLLTSRQMGKSSLTVRTARRLREEGVGVAVIDLAKIGGNVSPEQWYFGLVSKIARDLRLKDELESYWNENRSKGLLNRWIGSFPEVILARCPGNIVVFVDEVDAALSLPFEAGEFFAGIRSLFTARAEDSIYERLTFCLIGVATPSDLVKDPRTTPFNIGHQVDLEDFTPTEATSFAAGLNCPPAIANGIVQRILHWTGGHPYLTQRLCYLVASNPAITDELGVDKLCKEIYFAPGARETDQTLADVSRRVLETGIDRAGVLDLYRRIRGLRSVPDDETNTLGNTLRLSGLVVSRKGYLTVRNKIYRVIFDRAWIGRNMPNAEKRRQKAALLRGIVLSTCVALVIFALFGNLLIILHRDREKLVATAHRLDLQSKKANEQTEIAEKALAEAEDNARKAEANARTADRQTILAQHETKVVEQQSLQIKAAAVAASLASNPAEGLRQAIEVTGESLDIFHAVLPPVARSLKLAIDTSFERNVFHGHGGLVCCVVFVPDGKGIVSGSFDGTLALWDTSGKLEKQVYIERGTNGVHINRLRIAPDGRTIASVDDSNTIRIFDANLNQLLPAVKAHSGPISALAFSPDSQRIVSAGEDKQMKLWNLKGQVVGKPITVDALISSVVFTQDGQTIVAGGSDGSIREYNLSGDLLFKFAAGGNVPIKTLAISPDSHLIVATSDERTLRLWDLKGEPIGRPLEGHTSLVTTAVFSPDGSHIATGSTDKTIKIWNLGGQLLYELRGHQNAIHSVAYSPDGKLIVSGAGESLNALESTKDYTIRVWDAGIIPVAEAHGDTGEEFYSVTFHPKLALVGVGGNGTHLYSAGFHQAGLSVGKTREMVSAVAFSPDGKSFVNSENDGTIHISDLKGRNLCDPIKAHAGAISSLAFSSSGSMIASGGTDGSVRLWNLKGDLLQEIAPGNKDPISHVAFSPNGVLVAVLARDQQIKVYDRISKTVLPVREPESISGIGNLEDFQALAFANDGSIIAASGRDGAIHVWRLIDRAIIYMGKLSGHTAAVNSIAISRDGQTLASTSNDHTLRLWDLHELPVDFTELDLGPDRLLGAPYVAHDREAESVAFSFDGSVVVTAGRDGSVRSWNARWEQWLIVACDRMRFHPLLQSGTAQSVCNRYAWKIAKPSHSDRVADKVWKGDLGAVNDLIKIGADVNAPDLDGRPALSVAIWTGRADIAEALLSAGANIDSKDLDGDTPLSYAVLTRDSELVDLLMRHGAHVNEENIRGETPLARAISEQLGQIANRLVAAGAKVEKPFGTLSDNDGYSPIPEKYVPIDLDAETAMGNAYEIGKGVEQSFDLAILHFRIAAQQGSSYAEFRLGRLAYFGKGTPQSFAEALKWYERAAGKRNSWGQNNLARLYENGQGVAKDLERSFNLERMSAHQNNPWGQVSLARYYEQGIGTKRDLSEAIRWYRAAAETGDRSAQFALANLLESGQSGETGDEEAVRWFKAVADQGNIAAKQRLGWMFETGRGVPQSFDEALKLYKEAAEGGNTIAQASLGWIYENGLYVERNGQEAFRWYERAAGAGHWRAMIGMGRLYENGLGVPKSETEALKWYKRCADAGSEEAKSLISRFELAGKSTAPN